MIKAAAEQASKPRRREMRPNGAARKGAEESEIARTGRLAGCKLVALPTTM
jgi:hypothetical protein